MIYELQLDFEEPIQQFTDLTPLYEVLKQADHIYIYAAIDDRYKEMAAGCCIDPAKESLYIETSVSTEGVFVESEESWIENYLTGEFYSPEKRPFIETYLQE